eukprot:718853-Pelagomonas_calceolata.AAC.1
MGGGACMEAANLHQSSDTTPGYSLPYTCPRRPGEGTENEEQGIVNAELQPGGASLHITLLAAGFIIGAVWGGGGGGAAAAAAAAHKQSGVKSRILASVYPHTLFKTATSGSNCASCALEQCNGCCPSGSSVRDIMRQTGCDIKSWTEPAGPQSRRPSRTFVIEGDSAAVGHAVDIISAAVDRYKELCEGRCQGVDWCMACQSVNWYKACQRVDRCEMCWGEDRDKEPCENCCQHVVLPLDMPRCGLVQGAKVWTGARSLWGLLPRSVRLHVRLLVTASARVAAHGVLGGIPL